MNHQSLRLTPSHSPFFKNATPRSPTKTRSDEAGLRLKKIIGTTTASSNGFDCLPAKRQFAYCAGAATVVATVAEDLKVTQRFFRARPTAGNTSRDGAGAFPISPTPNEARSRALGHVRDYNIGGSPLGASSRDWGDSPSGKSATAKDRVKAATSVALSPNGKWVAMGETGYKPRILIFANGADSSESPVCALAEHTFGVQALSFSPDSKYLASLGTVSDGFLYLWSIDDRSGAALLHSSNKCTVVVNDMIWVGKSLLTVGLRFVKVWRPSDDAIAESRPSEASTTLGTPKQKNTDFGNSILSPKQKVFAGKNSLLGDLLNCNFITAVSLDDDSAVVCSESGDVAILNDAGRTQSLRLVAVVNFSISAARVERDGLVHVAGGVGLSECFDLQELQQRPPLLAKRDRRQSISPTKSISTQAPAVTTTASFAGIVLEMDTRRNIRLTRSADDESSMHPASHQLPAHNDAVLGARTISSSVFSSAEFFTFAGNGVVQLWDAQGAPASPSLMIPVESSVDMYEQTNELRAVAAFTTNDGEFLAAGDRYGSLTILDLRNGDVVAHVRAHSAEIADVLAFERSGVRLIATCSRDRTIQVLIWDKNQLDLIQTLDEHAAAVNGVLAVGSGDTLLSYSQDRTVVVREAALRQAENASSVVFIMSRSIALKSSPTCICPGPSADEILVSSMDRCIGLHNIKTGQAGFLFKCSDSDGGEAAIMSNIAYEPALNGNPTIIGIASSDKSVRLYSEFGSLIARDWGHTEGVTDLAILRSKRSNAADQPEYVQVVTVAADSTVFIWDTLPLTPPAEELTPESNGLLGTPSNASAVPLRPPLRKVLSFSELSRFKREKSIEESSDSPTSSARQTSPQRLRKKPSKVSMAQAPKLEPAFRGEHSRRRSLRKRSPSPPSPRTRKDATVTRKPSLGMTLRSKSSENVLNGVTSPTTNTGFGSVTASTESVCRTLRAYRKKISSPTALDNVAPETLRDLETELRSVLDTVGGRLPNKRADGDAMAKVLEEASEKIVSRLDERIKERVEDELRKSTDVSSGTGPTPSSASDVERGGSEVDAVTAAMEKVAIEK